MRYSLNLPPERLTSERGSTLVLVLLFSAILASIVIASHWMTLQSIKLWQSEVHALRARLAASGDLLLTAFSGDPVSGQTRCSRTRAAVGRFSVEREACFAGTSDKSKLLELPVIDGQNLPAGQAFPLLDYAGVFRELSPCILIPAPGNGQSSYGFMLSPSAVVSDKTCLSPPAGANFAVSANLASNQDFISPLLLAAAGYMNLNAGISISGDTLILAGGDLHIRELRAAGSTPSRVSLISASGRVVVEHTSASLILKVIGRNGVSLPFSPSGREGSPLPEPLKVLVYGLTRT